MQGLTDNWAGAIIIVLLMSLLFWCGLHGPNIVSGIIYPVLTANSLVNQNLMDQGIKATQANGGHYLVPQLIDCFCKFGGVGLTLGFIVAALLVAKSAQVRELSKLSLAPGIFNVNEPMIFGLPIVYNPIMLIPFICAPLVAVILTYGAMVIGFLPAFGAMQVPWTTPPIISGFLLGGWQGVVIQVLIFAASIAIWFPFVKMRTRSASSRSRTPRPSNRQAAGRPLRPATGPHDTTSTQPLNKPTSQQRAARPHPTKGNHHAYRPCCNQGMSTSMLVKKMREAAAKNGVDVQIDAYPISEIEEKAPDAAVIPARTAGSLRTEPCQGPVPEHPGRIHQSAGLRPGARRERAQPRDRARRQVISPIPASSDTTALGIPSLNPSLIPHHPTPRMTVRREPVTGAANTDERTVQWRTHPKPLTWKCCACR